VLLPRRGRPLTILRLDLIAEVNHCAVLTAPDLEALWNDSLLRYSRILDGLFHESVIICEGDSDCRFFEAVLDSADFSGLRRPDVHFVHVGGKGRLATAMNALRSMSVRAAVVADLDILRESSVVAKLIESAGGEFSEIEQDRAVIETAIGSWSGAQMRDSVRAEVDKIFESSEGPYVNEIDARRIRDLVRGRDGWSLLKRGGRALLEGKDVVSFDRILEYLRSINIFLVPVGEPERWTPDLESHGPSRVSEVLERGLHETAVDAQNFIVDVVRALMDDSPSLANQERSASDG